MLVRHKVAGRYLIIRTVHAGVALDSPGYFILKSKFSEWLILELKNYYVLDRSITAKSNKSS